MAELEVNNKAKYIRGLSRLKLERESYINHWEKITDNLLPRSGRYFLQDRNKGQRRNKDIYDSTATRALGVLAAGMMAGMSSPARRWFRLAASDQDLMEYTPVRQWLEDVGDILLDVFSRSNTYRVLHSLYEEMAAFGTGCAMVFNDYDDLIRLYPQTVGEFYLGQSNRYQVDTLYREFQMQIGPMGQEFGRGKLSRASQDLWDKGHLDEWVTVIHAIQPRKDLDPQKRDSKNMPWESVFIETQAEEAGFLRESGFAQFPALVPRWIVRGGDVYGSDCPGMTCLGDIKQLQDNQLKKAKGIDYMTDPPLQVPTALRGSEDVLPGGISYYDPNAPTGGIRTAYEVQLNLQHLLEDINDVRNRINGAFFVDLFQMMALSDRRQITAREVDERSAEKLLVLGPTLERNQNELLGPLIDQTFFILQKNELLPPPPEAIINQDLQIKYVSMLAQAQRAVGLESLDALLSRVGNMAQFRPDALDKLDSDRIVDEYAEVLGTPVEMVVSTAKARQARQAKAEQMAALQQQQAIPEIANTAKTLSETETSDGTALDTLIAQEE